MAPNITTSLHTADLDLQAEFSPRRGQAGVIVRATIQSEQAFERFVAAIDRIVAELNAEAREGAQ